MSLDSAASLLPSANAYQPVDSTSGCDTQAPDPDVRLRRREIVEACESCDLFRLQALAEADGGFLDDDLRRKACPSCLILSNIVQTCIPFHVVRFGPRPFPLNLYALSKTRDDWTGLISEVGPILLGTSGVHPDDWQDGVSWKTLPPHGDEHQVELDVNRAFIYYPDHKSDAELERHKAELSSMINEILRRHPCLCYFQGYHDICQVFLLVLGPLQRGPLAARLSLLRIRDFMLPSLDPTMLQLRLLPDILDRADPTLRRHLAGTEPFYALAGTLTMYAHNIQRYADIARLFDVLLAREPVFSVYMFAQIVLDRRAELFENPSDDSSMLHMILSKVPQDLNMERLISETVALFDVIPPEFLPSWRCISYASVLKTARPIDACASQTVQDGLNFFRIQAEQLRWAAARSKLAKTLWFYRRPARALVLAVAVGMLAFYLRRDIAITRHVTTRLWEAWETLQRRALTLRNMRS